MKSLQKGFTLLELMVTIAIVGIVAAIALWDSSDLLENDRAESYLQELKRSISFARAKATSSDAIVVVCSGATANIESNTAMNCSMIGTKAQSLYFLIQIRMVIITLLMAIPL